MMARLIFFSFHFFFMSVYRGFSVGGMQWGRRRVTATCWLWRSSSMLPYNDSFIHLEWSPESWMYDLRTHINELAITQLFLVGSHNAATCAVERSSPFGNDAPGMLCKHNMVSPIVKFAARDISSAWAKSQSMTIREQLDGGVRYLDLRITPHHKDGGRLYTTHGQLSVTLHSVLDDVMSFLNDPKSANEILILDFQHLVCMDDNTRDQFFEEINAMSSHCIPSDVPLTTSLSVIWNILPQQRIFLLMPLDDLQHPTARIRSESLVSIWVNKGCVKKVLRSLDSLLIDDLKKGSVSSVPSKLYITQAICTATKASIVSGVFGKVFLGVSSSLQDLAEKSNSSFLQWFCMLNAHSQLNGKTVTIPEEINTHGNILMLDYVQVGRCHIIGEALELNAVGMCVYLNLLRVSRRSMATNVFSPYKGTDMK